MICQKGVNAHGVRNNRIREDECVLFWGRKSSQEFIFLFLRKRGELVGLEVLTFQLVSFGNGVKSLKRLA